MADNTTAEMSMVANAATEVEISMVSTSRSTGGTPPRKSRPSTRRTHSNANDNEARTNLFVQFGREQGEPADALAWELPEATAVEVPYRPPRPSQRSYHRELFVFGEVFVMAVFITVAATVFSGPEPEFVDTWPQTESLYSQICGMKSVSIRLVIFAGAFLFGALMTCIDTLICIPLL